MACTGLCYGEEVNLKTCLCYLNLPTRNVVLARYGLLILLTKQKMAFVLNVPSSNNIVLEKHLT